MSIEIDPLSNPSFPFHFHALYKYKSWRQPTNLHDRGRTTRHILNSIAVPSDQSTDQAHHVKMRFSITTLSLLALFSFVSAEANAIPNADPVAEPNAAPDAEANTNNLWNAINGAAKAKQAAALNLKNFGMFGAIGFPKEQTWRQKCKKKNPKIEHVIAKFCERGTGK